MKTFTLIESLAQCDPRFPQEAHAQRTLMQPVDNVCAMSIYHLVQMSLNGLGSDGCSYRLIDPSSGQAAH